MNSQTKDKTNAFKNQIDFLQNRIVKLKNQILEIEANTNILLKTKNISFNRRKGSEQGYLNLNINSYLQENNNKINSNF